MAMADPREPYGRLFHEQGRLTVNAEREKPFDVQQWDDRGDEQQEIDMRGASAVAARAVADAKLEADRMRAQLLAFAAERDRTVRELNRLAKGEGEAGRPGKRDAYLAAGELVGRMGAEPGP
jgi:hypothetical protein